MEQKSSPYDIKEGDILRAVAAITNLPSSTLPDSPFIRALRTPAAQKTHHKLAPSRKSPGGMGTHPV